MEEILNYIKPELLVLTVVLYFIGAGLKRAKVVKDEYIPAVLGAAGIILCAVWVFAACQTATAQQIAMAVFTAIVQGILVAGFSSYAGRIVKRIKKSDEEE